ncbi:MAG: hypothetical protein AAFY46_11970, partial [Planctomycetota bacterium]
MIAIIALLIGILLPALGKARDSAKGALCLTNQRQIVLALTTYATDFNGRYPINVQSGVNGNTTLPDGAGRWAWFDVEVIGQFLPNSDSGDLGGISENNNRATVGGGVMQCPNHPNAGRSYTMNYWASSATFYKFSGGFSGDPKFLRPGFPGQVGENLGRGFDSTVDFGSQTMLVGGTYANYLKDSDDRGELRGFTEETMGSELLPGQRFGYQNRDEPIPGLTSRGLGGWTQGNSPELTGSVTDVRSYLPYYRHPRRTRNLQELEGKAQIGFVDGSVRSFSHSELVNEEGRPQHLVAAQFLFLV